MFRFLFRFVIIECLLFNVLSLYCYVCSNCDENLNNEFTSEFVGTGNDVSCYKLVSVLPDYSEIIVRGYSYAKCSGTQITQLWGYEQGFCCSTDYCNKTVTINGSIILILFTLIILFCKR